MLSLLVLVPKPFGSQPFPHSGWVSVSIWKLSTEVLSEMVPGGAAHRVVMVTFMLACGSLSLLWHLPHTHLLVIGLMKAYGPALKRPTSTSTRTNLNKILGKDCWYFPHFPLQCWFTGKVNQTCETNVERKSSGEKQVHVICEDLMHLVF